MKKLFSILLLGYSHLTNTQCNPPGDWCKSCNANFKLENNKLYAYCEKRNGEWVDTEIDLDQSNCTKGIENDNGQLRCKVTRPQQTATKPRKR